MLPNSEVMKSKSNISDSIVCGIISQVHKHIQVWERTSERSYLIPQGTGSIKLISNEKINIAFLARNLSYGEKNAKDIEEHINQYQVKVSPSRLSKVLISIYFKRTSVPEPDDNVFMPLNVQNAFPFHE